MLRGQMENYNHSSYPDSGDLSPRSREIECYDNPPPSCEDPSHHQNQQQQQTLPPNGGGNARIKLMCSYGGKIQPRPHDNQLSYIGGDTKILAVDRSIRYAAILARMASMSASPDVCFKYQLPGEDLDALVSVTNDDDLDHMMLEYDRLQRSGTKAARLRLFLFHLVQHPRAKSEDGQWFVDGLNSLPTQPAPFASSSPPPSAYPDFLFGLDKGFVPPLAVRVKDPAPNSPEHPTMVDASAMDGADAGTEHFKDERRAVGAAASLAPPADIERQIQELQRLQIASQEQELLQQQQQQLRMSEENLAMAFPGDYCPPSRAQEEAPPTQAQVPATYWQERHIAAGGIYASMAGGEHQVYLVPAPPAVYTGATGRPVAGQTYYAVQRMVSEPYREPAIYGVGLPPQQTKGPGQYVDGAVVARQQQGSSPGFAPSSQVSYDGAGRAYYTSTAGSAAGMVVPNYMTTLASGANGGNASGIESG